MGWEQQIAALKQENGQISLAKEKSEAELNEKFEKEKARLAKKQKQVADLQVRLHHEATARQVAEKQLKKMKEEKDLAEMKKAVSKLGQWKGKAMISSGKISEVATGKSSGMQVEKVQQAKTEAKEVDRSMGKWNKWHSRLLTSVLEMETTLEDLREEIEQLKKTNVELQMRNMQQAETIDTKTNDHLNMEFSKNTALKETETRLARLEADNQLFKAEAERYKEEASAAKQVVPPALTVRSGAGTMQLQSQD